MESYEITVRPAVTKFPVPTVHPSSSTDSVIALDVAPKGSPSPFGIHGYAWIDVCDKSILDIDNGLLPKNELNCARLGINESAVWVGSVGYYNATPKPVEIVVDAKPKMRLETDFNVVFETTMIGTKRPDPGSSNSIIGLCLEKDGIIHASSKGRAANLNRTCPGVLLELRCGGNVVGNIAVHDDGVTLHGFKQIDDLISRVQSLESAR